MVTFSAKMFALAAFAAVAIFLGLVLWRALFPTHHPVEKAAPSNEQYAQQQSAEQHSPVRSAEVSPDREIARYTLALAVFTALLVLVSIFQIAFLISADQIAGEAAGAAKDSAKYAKEAAEVANKTLIETQRPWMEPLEISVGSPLVFDDQGLRVTIASRLKNVGNVPAINVRLLAFILGGGLDVLNEQEKFCVGVKKQPDKSGPTVFPNQVTGQSISIPLSKADIEKFGMSKPGDTRKFITPIVIGCIDYQLPVNGEHRQTRFAYSLSELQGADDFVIYPERGIIPQDRLRLRRWIGGGFSAD
jgi:hypothetical protein